MLSEHPLEVQSAFELSLNLRDLALLLDVRVLLFWPDVLVTHSCLVMAIGRSSKLSLSALGGLARFFW